MRGGRFRPRKYDPGWLMRGDSPAGRIQYLSCKQSQVRDGSYIYLTGFFGSAQLRKAC